MASEGFGRLVIFDQFWSEFEPLYPTKLKKKNMKKHFDLMQTRTRDHWIAKRISFHCAIVTRYNIL